jgi:hypothetical protein
MQALFSVAIRPDQVESINRWISGICKDYPGIIPMGAMHPEHPDPEAESMWVRKPGIKRIKRIKLHGYGRATSNEFGGILGWLFRIYKFPFPSK